MNFDVRMHQMNLVNALRAYVQRRLRLKLGRHAGHVRTLELRLTEQDSTTGTGAKLCFLKAKLVPSGELIIAERNTDLYTAVSRAIERLKTALRRKIERRRSERRRRVSIRDPIC